MAVTIQCGGVGGGVIGFGAKPPLAGVLTAQICPRRREAQPCQLFKGAKQQLGKRRRGANLHVFYFQRCARAFRVT